MKALLSFLLLLLPTQPHRMPPSMDLPISASQVCNWYVRRNDRHATPELPQEFSFIGEEGGFYADLDAGEDKVLYLTFDAGYENGNVSRILDTLKEKEVPAAFFILSHLVNAEPALVRRMIDEGHTVCNHTAKHRDLTRATREEFREELRSLEDLYREKMGQEIAKFYRPPEGKFTRENLKYAKELGYSTVFWSFAYADWANDRQPEPEKAKEMINANLHNGAVLLLHPTSSTNAEILPALIESWKAAGYRFGTIAELTGK